MVEELREHPRRPVRLSAEVQVGVETLAAVTVDLSAGGIGLTLRHRLEEARPVHVSVFLTHDGVEDPDTPPLDVRATVAWGAPSDDGSYRAGLKFEPLDAVRRIRLEELLASLG